MDMGQVKIWYNDHKQGKRNYHEIELPKRSDIPRISSLYAVSMNHNLYYVCIYIYILNYLDITIGSANPKIISLYGALALYYLLYDTNTHWNTNYDHIMSNSC